MGLTRRKRVRQIRRLKANLKMSNYENLIYETLDGVTPKGKYESLQSLIKSDAFLPKIIGTVTVIRVNILALNESPIDEAFKPILQSMIDNIDRTLKEL